MSEAEAEAARGVWRAPMTGAAEAAGAQPRAGGQGKGRLQPQPGSTAQHQAVEGALTGGVALRYNPDRAHHVLHPHGQLILRGVDLRGVGRGEGRRTRGRGMSTRLRGKAVGGDRGRRAEAPSIDIQRQSKARTAKHGPQAGQGCAGHGWGPPTE